MRSSSSTEVVESVVDRPALGARRAGRPVRAAARRPDARRRSRGAHPGTDQSQLVAPPCPGAHRPGAEVPRTRSGKIVELAVRDVVHGRPVRNREALANPEALDQFRDRTSCNWIGRSSVRSAGRAGEASSRTRARPRRRASAAACSSGRRVGSSEAAPAMRNVDPSPTRFLVDPEAAHRPRTASLRGTAPWRRSAPTTRIRRRRGAFSRRISRKPATRTSFTSSSRSLPPAHAEVRAYRIDSRGVVIGIAADSCRRRTHRGRDTVPSAR